MHTLKGCHVGSPEEKEEERVVSGAGGAWLTRGQVMIHVRTTPKNAVSRDGLVAQSGDYSWRGVKYGIILLRRTTQATPT